MHNKVPCRNTAELQELQGRIHEGDFNDCILPGGWPRA